MKKSECAKEICNQEETLLTITRQLEEMAAKTFEGLWKHKGSIIDNSKKIGINIVYQARQCNPLLLPNGAEEIEAATVVICNELMEIKKDLDKMNESALIKVKGEVLFSDKAVGEIKDFFTIAVEGLRNLHDIILTKNRVLANYLLDQIDTYEEIGLRYTDEHQERLIKGVCLAQSSVIYLQLLASLRDLLNHQKAIALTFI